MKALLGNYHLLKKNMLLKMIGLLSLQVLFLNAACFASNTDLISDEEKTINSLNAVLMCPVCPGESIDQSQNDLAVQMRGIVKVKLEQGWTEEQIKDFFVDGYGPSVLLEPSSSGFNLVLWIVPPIVLFVAILAVVIILIFMSRPIIKSTDSEICGVAELNSRLEDELTIIETALGYGSDVVVNSECVEVEDSQNKEED